MPPPRPGSTDASVNHSSSSDPSDIPDYDLARRIGAGAMGEVWLARNRVTDTLHAVKIVRRQTGESSKSFDREYNAIQNYEPISRADPSLMPILHVGRNEQVGFFYYVMELADDAHDNADSQHDVNTGSSNRDQATKPRFNPSIATILHNYQPRVLRYELETRNRLSVIECVQLGLALCSALTALHSRGLLHRDVKPSNIIFVNRRPKLADIGLVERADATMSLVGTEGYCAPEGPSSPRADIYSLGKVLYEASTGKDRQRFPEPLSQLAMGEDPTHWAELNEVILKACRSNPSERYSSAKTLAMDLELLLSGRSIRRLKALRRRVRIATALAVFLTLAFVSILLQERHKTAVAREAARISAEKENLRRFRHLLGQAQLLRLGPHSDGWSRHAGEKLAEAASLKVDDAAPELQREALELKKGIDAIQQIHWMGLSKSALAFHPKKPLLVAANPSGLHLISLLSQSITTLLTNSFLGTAVSSSGVAALVSAPSGAELIWCAEPLDRPLPPRKDLLSGIATARAISFSKDPALFALQAVMTNGLDQTVLYRRGSIWGSIPGNADKILLSDDGSLLARGSAGTVSLWSVADQRLINEFRLNSLDASALGFVNDPVLDRKSPRHTWLLAIGDSGGTVTLWDPWDKRIRNYYRGSLHDIFALGSSTDGTILVSAGRAEARLWDTANGSLLLRLGGDDQVNSIAISPDFKAIAVSSGSASSSTPGLSLWNIELGRGIDTLRGLMGPTGKLCFSRDGRRLAALSHSWQVGVWDLATKQLLFVFPAPKGVSADNAALAFDSAAARLAFCAGSRAVLWDVSAKAQINEWELPDGTVDSMAFNAKDEIIVSRYEKHALVVRRLPTPEQSLLLKTDSYFNKCLFTGSLTPDASVWIVEGVHTNGVAQERAIKAYKLPSLTEIWSIPIVKKPAYGVAIIEPAGTLASVQITEIIGFSPSEFIDLANGHITGHLSTTPSALSPHATHYIANGVPEDPARGFSLFRRPENKGLFSFSSEDFAYPSSPQFSPDGSSIAWGNSDGTILLFHLPAGYQTAQTPTAL